MPRFCLFRSFSVNARFWIDLFAGELIPGETVPEYVTHYEFEAISVLHFLAVVEAKGLLVQIASQVNRINADVGALECAL